jgi:uncharacterized SAM-binding protein YcdF (DUF218 family)
MLARAWSVGCRILGALTVVGFIVAAFTPAPRIAARWLVVAPDVKPAGAIVVLGASGYRDGTLGDASLRRAVAGIRLYREGLAPRIVFLGMAGEAESRARLAVTFGVPREAIITESEEPTTRNEAHRMNVVLRQRLGVRDILLVTDVLHMRRARALFERAGLVVRPAPTDTGVLGAASPAAAVGVVLETIGATVLFFVANLTVGAMLVLGGRWFSYFYTTLYEVTDITLLIVSVIQALLVTIWRRG